MLNSHHLHSISDVLFLDVKTCKLAELPRFRLYVLVHVVHIVLHFRFGYCTLYGPEGLNTQE